MLKNYFNIAWRTLLHNKLYSVINIAGLTFGISCFILIGLYLFDELTFDRHHTNADRIYRVVEHKNVKGEETTIAAAGYKLATESKKLISEVENTTRFARNGRANLVDPQNPVYYQETVSIADENFLSIFDFPLLSGNRKTALKEPNAIIITEDLAKRLFGHTDVMGKTLEFSFLDNPLKITGVLKNHPSNSSFDFNSLLSDATFQQADGYKEMIASDWVSNNFTVYTQLKPGSNPDVVSAKLTKLLLANFKPEQGTKISYSLQALPDIHLYSQNIVDGARNSNVEAISQGSIQYIKVFAIVALFVLLIGCINYMNLTTARSSNRLKEIGVRKSIGAFRSHLVKQFLLESLLVTSISFALSIGLVNLILPAFSQFVNKKLSLGFASDYRIWLISITVSIIVGLLAGSYPALVLSRFKTALLLKGLKIQDRTGLSLRKGLVIFQFAISTVILIATIVLFMQVRFLNNTNLGFNKDLLVVVDVNSGKTRNEFEVIKTEMSKIPAVKSVSVSSRVPGEWKSISMVKFKTIGNTEELQQSYLIGADIDFLKTFEIKLLKGRNFSSPNDSANIIINETAARILGIEEPSGQVVEMPMMSRGGEFTPINSENTPFTARVIGIVKDFHFQSLREKIAPLVLAYNKNPIYPIDYYTARIDSKNIHATLEKLKAVMLSVNKEDPFEYHFLDEQLSLFYKEDQRRQTLLIWVALSTIFIACLGLFGLATYSAEQRIKEIGVRKVLGASVLNLATLLSGDFLKLVFIAILVAFPVAWWATNKWLQEFAYRIDLSWWVFVLAGIIALMIALVTVSFQSIRAAAANPVKALRSE